MAVELSTRTRKTVASDVNSAIDGIYKHMFISSVIMKIQYVHVKNNIELQKYD